MKRTTRLVVELVWEDAFLSEIARLDMPERLRCEVENSIEHDHGAGLSRVTVALAPENEPSPLREGGIAKERP